MSLYLLPLKKYNGLLGTNRFQLDIKTDLCPLYTNPCNCPTKFGMVAVIWISSSAWKSPPKCRDLTSSVLCRPSIVSAIFLFLSALE